MQPHVEGIREEDYIEFLSLGLLKTLGSTGTHVPPNQVHRGPEASCFLDFAWHDVKFPGDDISLF